MTMPISLSIALLTLPAWAPVLVALIGWVAVATYGRRADPDGAVAVMRGVVALLRFANWRGIPISLLLLAGASVGHITKLGL